MKTIAVLLLTVFCLALAVPASRGCNPALLPSACSASAVSYGGTGFQVGTGVVPLGASVFGLATGAGNVNIGNNAFGAGRGFARGVVRGVGIGAGVGRGLAGGRSLGPHRWPCCRANRGASRQPRPCWRCSRGGTSRRTRAPVKQSPFSRGVLPPAAGRLREVSFFTEAIMTRTRIDLLTCTAAAAVAVLLTLRLWAVPAPLPKQVAPPPVGMAGDYSLTWQWGRGTCTLHPAGAWSCTWFGQSWLGDWREKDGPAHGDRVRPAGDRAAHGAVHLVRRAGEGQTRGATPGGR